MDFPLRGQIWLVNFDPTVSSEIKKTRPALVISNDINNQYSDTVTVIPMTEKSEKIYPFEVAITSKTAGLAKDSKAKCQQIRTIDKIRLVKLFGNISSAELKQSEHALMVHLGIEQS